MLKVKAEYVHASAWSASRDNPSYLCVASGTEVYANQLDIFDIHLQNTPPSTTHVGKATSTIGFNKLAWSNPAYGPGLIAGGMNDGTITLWSPLKLSKSHGVLKFIDHELTKVRAIDSHPFQPNPIVSGHKNCEIVLWDIITQQGSSIFVAENETWVGHRTTVKWSKASSDLLAFASGSTSKIWDTRGGASTNITDLYISDIEWHPTDSNKLLVATSNTNLKLWDRRNLHSPLWAHNISVDGVSWSSLHPDIALSHSMVSTECWDTHKGTFKRGNYSGGANFLQWSSGLPHVVSVTREFHGIFVGTYSLPISENLKKSYKHNVKLLKANSSQHQEAPIVFLGPSLELSKTKETLARVQSQLSQEVLKNLAAEQKNEALLNELQAFRQHNEEAKGTVKKQLRNFNLEKLTADLSDEKTKFNTLSSDFLNTAEKLNHAQNEIDRLTKEVTILRSSKPASEAQVMHLNAKLNQERASRIKDAESIRTLKKELTTVKATLANMEETATVPGPVSKECIELEQLKRTGRQCAKLGHFSLAKAYFQVLLHEGKATLSSEEIAELDQESDAMRDTATKKRAAQLDEELNRMREKYEKLANKYSTEAQELINQRDQMEREKEALRHKIEELKRKEEVLKKQNREFERQCAEWKTKAQYAVELKASRLRETEELVEAIKNSNSTVLRDKAHLEEKLAEAEAARERLRESEKTLQEKVDCLQHYLAIVEQQGMLPEAVIYRDLLKSCKRMKKLANSNKVKCFISYAWQPDKSDNAILQAKLKKMKGDLNTAGVDVILDVCNMEGDINHFMMDGVQSSDRVLLICTPRLKTRAEEGNNNIRTEVDEALRRQKLDAKFIIPLILEGDRKSSISTLLPNMLAIDFSNPKLYCEKMTSLAPKGLLPMLLGLEDNKLYSDLLSGYRAKVELLNNSIQAKNATGITALMTSSASTASTSTNANNPTTATIAVNSRKSTNSTNTANVTSTNV